MLRLTIGKLSSGQQAGQRLWGADGIDYLHAFASSTQPADINSERLLQGDELHGGAGGDWLYGNIRKELFFGDAGNDTVLGDWLRGPDYAINAEASLSGRADTADRRRRRAVWR